MAATLTVYSRNLLNPKHMSSVKKFLWSGKQSVPNLHKKINYIVTKWHIDFADQWSTGGIPQ